MQAARRTLSALLAFLLVVPVITATGPTAYAEDGTCIHVDVSITAGGELLTKGPAKKAADQFGLQECYLPELESQIVAESGRIVC